MNFVRPADFRLLIVDDNEAIHSDLKKILLPSETDSELADDESLLFGSAAAQGVTFAIDSAFQGQDGLVCVKQAQAAQDPYALAFVDVRMPPGWDGIETISHIWKTDPAVQIVICTAYSDYNWQDIQRRLGITHNFVILKKPFDIIEVRQLAHALTAKWMSTRQARLRMEELDSQVERRTAELVRTNQELKAEIALRRRTEEALRMTEERFRQVVEGAPIGILIQTDGIIRYVNPAALSLFGAETADQLIGTLAQERVHPNSLAVVNERIRILKEDGSVVPFLEEQHVRLDGTAFDSEVTARTFIFEGQEGAIVFILDVTERKREENERLELEQQLQQAQKMQAVGRLAGGVAHDFNNLLMVIQSYAETLQGSLPAHTPLRKSTQEIMKAAERGAKLTRQMLAFSRKQVFSPVVLDLNAVVSETAKMLKRIIGEDIEFRVVSAESLWAIEADANQIVQVLMNLCVNARDAMPQGGTLTITTENVTVEVGGVGSLPRVSPGDYVKVTVADTGEGMDKGLQKRIFEPFFTTKEVGKGTGLGLAMVYGIVEQSGGYVSVDSEPGQGACFTIYLRRAIKTVAPESSLTAEARVLGTETLLVAEDEDALREAISDYLCTLGYTVLTAGTGDQALSVASQHEQKIDLLITDVVMPKTGGRELSQRLRSQRPDLKTIYISGYTDDAVLQHGVLELGAVFLQKPFRLDTLARRIRNVLQASADNLDVSPRRPALP